MVWLWCFRIVFPVWSCCYAFLISKESINLKYFVLYNTKNICNQFTSYINYCYGEIFKEAAPYKQEKLTLIGKTKFRRRLVSNIFWVSSVIIWTYQTLMFLFVILWKVKTKIPNFEEGYGNLKFQTSAKVYGKYLRFFVKLVKSFASKSLI